MSVVVYDLETYPNVFTATFKPIDKPTGLLFEVSERRNDTASLLTYLVSLTKMIGFNNMGFDWPILHHIRTLRNPTPDEIYHFAMKIINSNDRFRHTIWNPDIPQVDLYLINHFNNRAKSTSLKKLQFNMRSELVQDLPFEVGTSLTSAEIDVLLQYNVHDVLETEKFFYLNADAIALREAIEPAWINQSDTGLGRKYFERELEAAGVMTRTPSGPIVTMRPDGVALADIIFPYLQFRTPVLSQALEWFKRCTIFDNTDETGRSSRTECSHEFELDGLQVVMGLGGLHASIDRKVCRASDDIDIVDVDAVSFYPRLSIVNRIFPEHLTEVFCDVYAQLLDERLKHAKGTPTNKMLKLALNSVFGSSGSYYTCFGDLRYMLSVTINGQFLILSLAEYLLSIPSVHIIQMNTDGITLRVAKKDRLMLDAYIKAWGESTQIALESVDYKAMWIRDVNNYIAEYPDGTRKRKGAYDPDRQWHQNHSMAVVRHAAEAAMCHGQDIDEFVKQHSDPWDFLLRLDLTRASFLKLDNGEVHRGVVRYYVSNSGHQGTKYMPKTQTKIHATGHASCTGKRGAWACDGCGEVFKRKVDWQAHSDSQHSSRLTIVQQYKGEPIDFDIRFYAGEARKLVITDEWEWTKTL